MELGLINGRSMLIKFNWILKNSNWVQLALVLVSSDTN